MAKVKKAKRKTVQFQDGRTVTFKRKISDRRAASIERAMKDQFKKAKRS